MWLWGCFAPHPPIIVAEVGCGREREAQKTLDGMALLGERVAAKMPDTLLVLSPHFVAGPGLALVAAERYVGDLGQFGAPQAGVDAPGDRAGAVALMEFLGPDHVAFRERSVMALDHATLVPLLFLAKAWGKTPKLIVANPLGLDLQQAFEMGQKLRQFASENAFALLASGDLSHRLTHGAPAGYAPEGKTFDAAVVEAFRQSSSGPIFDLSSHQIEAAGECGLRSALVLLGLAGSERMELLSYEGPFGVGYCTALWSPRASREEVRP